MERGGRDLIKTNYMHASKPLAIKKGNYIPQSHQERMKVIKACICD